MNNFPIPEMAKQYLEYDMIQKHTELPGFPEFRVRLLYAFLNKHALPDKQSELFALVASLMQMGLDTHDMVPVSSDAKEKRAARARQLKVLAGDYLSSRFYNLLAQAGQIEMIRHLSAAICEVNRLKVNLYMLMKQLKLTAEEYIHQSVNIKIQLFLPFSRRMQGICNRVWPDVLHSFTRCEVIAQEMFRLESPQTLQGSWAFWHIWQSGTKEERKQLASDEPDPLKIRSLLLKYNVSGQLYHMLETQLQQIWSFVKQLDSEKLKQELLYVGEMFAGYLSKPKVLEER